jgi:protein phosphatase
MNTVEIAAIRLQETPLNLSATARSDCGKVRQENQDSFHIDPANRFFIVADGMGGQNGGKVASQLSCDAVASALDGADPTRTSEETLKTAFNAAFEALTEAVDQDQDLSKMGTTLLCALMDSGDEMVVAHLGDSRLYRLRDGRLRRMTDDHNVLSELVRAGVLSGKNIEENQRLGHLLTRAVSPNSPDRPDVFRTIVYPGDRYILCSDGLHGVLDDIEIESRLSNKGRSPDEICQDLVEATLDAGAPDNVTLVMMVFN